MSETDEAVQRLAHAEYLTERLTDLFARADGDPQDDEALDEINEIPYALSTKHQYEILLAGGGPTHELVVTLDSDFEIEDVTSVASWASEPVRVRIAEDSVVWRFAQYTVEPLIDELKAASVR